MVTGRGQAISVEHLELDALIHWIERVSDTEKDAGITFRLNLEFEIEHEVAVFLFGEEVGIKTLPARLTSSRL